MVITDSTLSTSLWTEIKNLCVTALTTASITASVEPAYNAKKNSKPLVVIPPIKTPKTKNKFGGSLAGSNSGRYDITVSILCYARNTLDVDNVKQAITNGLETTFIDGVSLSSFEDDYSFADINDTPFHLITITAMYNRE